MPLSLYSKDSMDNLLADKLDLAGGTMTGGLTLSATGIIFSDSTTMTTAPAGGALAADQLTVGVVAVNPTAGPTTAGDVLQYDGTDLIWTPGAGGSFLPLAGGAMDADAEVTLSDTSNHDSELAGWGLGVQLTNDHAQGTTVEYNGLFVYDSAGQMNVAPTGLTFPDATTQTTAGYPNTNPDGFQTSTDVSTYVTGLGYQTAGDVSTYVGANAYPLSGNPSGFLTSVPGKTVNTVDLDVADYILVLGDANNIVNTYGDGSNSGYVIKVPLNSSVAFPIGTEVLFTNINAGTFNYINAVGGVTVVQASPSINSGYMRKAVKLDTNTWLISSQI